MSPAAKERYMAYLLDPAGTASERDRDSKVFARAQEELAGVTEEGELHARVAVAPSDEKEAYARAAMLRGANEAVQASIEHRLKRFMGFLEPNPRAMKLLVTAYGIYVDYASASGEMDLDDERRDQIALFTILSLRWPAFVEYLTKFPEELERLKKPPPEAPLKADASERDRERAAAERIARRGDVHKVLTGNGLGVALTRGTLDVLVGNEASRK
jgi:hypothetical protein